MKLGTNIKSMRKERELSQEQLAEVMGVSTASISKWETGQTAPELTMLMGLADYFEVSVDTLMGHEVSGNRVETLLAEMDRAEEENDFSQAKEIAEKLLRNYPNSAEVVERVANCYYRIRVKTDDKKAIETSIELTKRLFALEADETGMKRFELLGSLGNQYSMAGNWKMARECYTKGNVCNVNDRELAYLLTSEEKDKEAITAISDVWAKNMYFILMDIIKMAEGWKNLGEYQKAEEALLWGCRAVENLSGEYVAHLKDVKSTMYFILAVNAEENEDIERADKYIISALKGETQGEGYDFLTCSKSEKVIGNAIQNPVALQQMLQAMGLNRLAEKVSKMA